MAPWGSGVLEWIQFPFSCRSALEPHSRPFPFCLLLPRPRCSDFHRMPYPARACMPSPFSGVRLFATPWTVASQAPPFQGFSRQEYWSGLPCPSPGELPDLYRMPYPPPQIFTPTPGLFGVLGFFFGGGGFWPCRVACAVLVPLRSYQGSDPCHLHWKHRVSIT